MSELKKAIIDANDKLDKITEDISEIKVVQASQAADLRYHIKRSDQNEARIEMVEDRLLPLIETKNKVDGAFKMLGITGTILGLFFAGIKAIQALSELF